MSLSLPIQQKERIVIVDVLRGFALFGVLLGNFNGMVTNYVPESIIKSISSSFDNVLNMLHDVFVQNKFMTLFSILFGYGFGVIMERVANKNLNTTHFFSAKNVLVVCIWLYSSCILGGGYFARVCNGRNIFITLPQKQQSQSFCVVAYLNVFDAIYHPVVPALFYTEFS